MNNRNWMILLVALVVGTVALSLGMWGVLGYLRASQTAAVQVAASQQQAALAQKLSVESLKRTQAEAEARRLGELLREQAVRLEQADAEARRAGHQASAPSRGNSARQPLLALDDPFVPNQANRAGKSGTVPTPTPVGGAVLRVLVTDQLENGLPNCVVEIATDPDDPTTPNKLILKGTTRPDGQHVTTGLPAARYTVRVRTPLAWVEKAELTRTVVLAEGQLANERFEFTASDSLPVLVVDAAEEPIAGASVVATVAGAERDPIETDSNGQAVVAAVPGGAAIEKLTVVHPDYTSQTRSGLTAMDGTQTFRLQRRGELKLRVVWASDGQPVMSYEYRLLRRTDGGIFGLTGVSGSVSVQSADGTTSLNSSRDLDPSQWRVEVVVPASGATGIDLRGAATFAIGTDGQPQEILVKIGAGAVMRGRVTQDVAGGKPVAGATVTVTSPHRGFSQFPDDPRFLPGPVTTDNNGNFAWDGVAAGSYGLIAESGALKSGTPLDVVVHEDGTTEPRFIELVIKNGGAIYGVVSGPGGEPIAGATVMLMTQSANADGWGGVPPARSDAQGQYRLEGLPAGAHYVMLQLPPDKQDLGTTPREIVNVALGEEKRHDFDLSGQVKLSGVLTLSGEPNGGRITALAFSGGVIDVEWIALRGDRYEVMLYPGTYSLRGSGPLDLNGTLANIVVPTGVAEHTLDIDLPVVATDVVLVFPDNLPVVRGQAILRTEAPGQRYAFERLRFEQENRYIATLIAGRYQATFTSFDKQWRGDTEWIDIGANASRELIIDVYRTVDGVRIGGWAPGQLNNAQWRTLTFDITEAVAGANGSASVLASYEKGRHAVELRSARLLIDGRVVNQDNHAGWTGADHWGNRFRLALGEVRAGVRYAVEIDMKPDGGDDTTGSVYLTVK